MIFVTGKDGSMFLMLSEKDISLLRQGNTKFVDQRHTGGVPFNRVVLSLHKTDEESQQILRKAGHFVPDREDMRTAEPSETESRCNGCDCIIDRGGLFEGKCITCWATLAKGSNPIKVADKISDGQHSHK